MNKVLPILAIESSAELCSAALLIKENNSFEKTFTGKHVHSEKLLTAVNSLFHQSGTSIKDIRSIAISVGPGSFTGLRIGMAMAKGLAFGANLPIIPVPTYDAFALQLSGEIENGDKFVIANSVNTEELYAAEFQKVRNSIVKLKDVYLIKKKDFHLDKFTDNKIFGNYLVEKSKKNTSSPYALFVAKWAYLFGKDLLTSHYDYLEPNYIKNFIAKVKK